MFIIKNVSLLQVDESGEKKWTKWFSTMHPTKSENSDMTVMHARAQAVINTKTINIECLTWPNDQASFILQAMACGPGDII